MTEARSHFNRFLFLWWDECSCSTHCI